MKIPTHIRSWRLIELMCWMYPTYYTIYILIIIRIKWHFRLTHQNLLALSLYLYLALSLYLSLSLSLFIPPFPDEKAIVWRVWDDTKLDNIARKAVYFRCSGVSSPKNMYIAGQTIQMYVNILSILIYKRVRLSTQSGSIINIQRMYSCIIRWM